ncbi:hypothetical protein GGQ80_002046 [Sphingomonas jinjuensis]|uniref:Uncharacterized protein n=1 Tax=Sphingomonas jinjuensis TaxID=535907 RepID=A0A840FD11_9SPHN|nr:hypothetical protein [Sphingomonas jinjuensis]MBB4154136.1 hypothetical protein [Sphingomonas jinjuensis]
MSRLDPNTPPIGRQPLGIKVTPSKAGSPWIGTIADAVRGDVAVEGGQRFTLEQQRELMTRGGDVPTAPTLVVKRQAEWNELWWPLGSLPPVFAFECPIVGRRGDRVKVIAPSGVVKLVAEDGWAHRPYRRARDQWGNKL